MNQVGKKYQCSDPMMAAYLAEVRKMERRFDGLELRHVLRRENQLAGERISSPTSSLGPRQPRHLHRSGPLKKGSKY